MADYGYAGYEYYDYDQHQQQHDHDDRRAGAGRCGPTTESFDYGHGRAEEVWDDRRQSPARGREGRNGRHYDEPQPRHARGGLLKTPPEPPPPSHRYDDYDQQDDYNPEFDRGTRRQYSPPPSRPHHSRSRSPLIRQEYDLPPPPRHDEHYPNYHEEQGRGGPRKSRLQERKQVFEYDARDYRPPPEGDPNRHHSRDRDRPSRYGADVNDEPHFQRPLLPEPDTDFQTNNQRSFSAERDRSRNRVDQRYQDRALLPNPEPEQREREPYRQENQRQSRHSYSPEIDRNRPRKLENKFKGQQEYRKPPRDSRPALLPEPELQAQVQHGNEAQKSEKDVLGGFVPPGVQKNVKSQMQMEVALYQNQQLLQNLEQTQKKDHQKFDEFRREEMKRLGAPPNSSNQTRDIISSQLDAERKRQIDEELRQLGINQKSQPRANTHHIVSGQLDAERRRQIDEELSRLGIGARQERGNYNLPSLLPTILSDEQLPSLMAEPAKNKSAYPSAQTDEQQARLVAGPNKNRGSIYPSTTSHSTSYPTGVQQHSSDYNQDVYSKPALQSNGSGRQTLLPDPSLSQTPRGHSDCLLPTPEGRLLDNPGGRQPNRKDDGKRPGRPQENDDSRRKRFRADPKQPGGQERQQPNRTRSRSSENRQDNRRNQGYSNNMYTNKKETSYKGTVGTRPQQPIKKVDDDDDVIEIIEIPPPVKKPVPQPEQKEAPMGKGMMQEVNLVAETLAKRDTILEPSKMANTMKMITTKRKDTQPPWKRGLDEKVADNQYQSLLQLGDYAKYLLYDTILDGFQCYICPSTFVSKKVNKDHETGFTHKHILTTLQKKPAKNEAPSEQRTKVMQRLAAMPIIYGNKGQDGKTSIRAELVGRDDYYFVCRVCHEVYRGPAEHHFTSSSHINLEKKQGKCVECQIYFGSTEKRKNHFTQPLHKKVQSFRMKFKNSQPTQEASKKPTTSTPATVVQSKPVVTKSPTTTTLRPSTAAPPKSETKKAPVSDRSKLSSDRGRKVTQTTSSKTSLATTSRKPVSNPAPSSHAQHSVSALLKSLRDDEEAKKQDNVDSKSRGTGATRTNEAVAKKETVKTSGVTGKGEGQKQVAKQQPGGGNFTAKIPTLVKANPDWKGEVRGLNFTSPVVGFFCKVCAKFYNEKSSTREKHCTTLQHQLNMKAFLMKNAKDKPLPQWMDGLPGSTPQKMAAAAGAKKSGVPKVDTKNKQPVRKTDVKAEMADNIEVVDMDVDGRSTPDSKEGKERTSEWFDGDIEEEV